MAVCAEVCVGTGVECFDCSDEAVVKADFGEMTIFACANCAELFVGEIASRLDDDAQDDAEDELDA